MLDWLMRKWRRGSAAGKASGEAGAQSVMPDPGNEEIQDSVRRAESLLAADPGAALQILDAVIRRAPENIQVLRLAGLAAGRLEDNAAALDYFNLGLHFAPHDWELLRHKVDILRAVGDAQVAKRELTGFLAVHPGSAEAKMQLAHILYAEWDCQAAISLLREVVAADPMNCSALNFLGFLLAREGGDLEQGEATVSLALRLDPHFQAAKSNLGWILAERGRLVEGLKYFDEVLASDPEDGETRLMRAYANLKHGHFSAGWADFDARLDSPMHRRRRCCLPLPASDSGLTGRRVFVASEQGLGDQIMFASCLPELIAESPACLVECDDRLVGIFRRSFPSAEIIGESSAEMVRDQAIRVHGCENEISMGSLARFYRNRPAEFPRHSGYLHADQDQVDSWKRRLDQLGAGPKIGISWRGGAMSTRQQLRSIMPGIMASKLAGIGTLVSLQYGTGIEEIRRNQEEGGVPVAYWQDAIDDYDQTAALVMALDLVISVCTAIVHLGGALGKPVWVLAPAVAEWRYLAQGDGMPWYPSARIFRQSAGESWSSVLERVAKSVRSNPPWK